MSKHRSFPPEWAEQSAVMLTWPHKDTDWANNLDAVFHTFAQIACAILKHENLLVVAHDENHIKEIKKCISTESEFSGFMINHDIRCLCIHSNDSWARDHGPITILIDEMPRLLDFNFNAWGEKYPYIKDNAISQALYQQKAFSPNIEIQSIPMILEGGGIESDGYGQLLVTEQCVLNPNRNKDWTKNELENTLKKELGIDRILWIQDGYLAGDDTDSHIDTLARFCPNNKIAYVQCLDEQDEHFNALSRMEQQLKALKNHKDEPYELIPLPMPEAIYEDKERLPATYANFLIINDAVLLPVYDVKQDQEAIKQITLCFPDREIITINCCELIKQHGSLHCVTMQLPKGVF
jgi:agmatine deiminase